MLTNKRKRISFRLFRNKIDCLLKTPLHTVWTYCFKRRLIRSNKIRKFIKNKKRSKKKN